MVAYNPPKLRHLFKIEFVRFCIVGGTGFVINFIIYTFLHHIFHAPVFIAQLIGAEIALFSNFMMHHHWTYKAHKVEKSISKLVIQFHATTWPAILGSALMVTAGEKLLHLSYLSSLILSSLIALLWNFVWSKYVVWRDVTNSEIEKIV